MDQQGSQVRIALLADAPQASALTRGVLTRGEAQIACKVSSGREALDVDDGSAQSSGSEIADAWDLEQSLDDRIVYVKPLQFSIEVFAALLERVDLLEQLDQAWVQERRHRTCRIGQRRSNGIDRTLGAQWDADAELAQAPAQKADARVARAHPLRAQTM